MRASLARGLVFVTSAAVLVVEILAVRIMAPYLGVSLETFTAVVGVILAGISLGAWLGGNAADRGEPSALLGPLLVGGGATTALAPLIVDQVGPGVGTDALSAVVISAVAFLVPSALLSAVPPVVVKIRLLSLDDTGRVVGAYSAIGTAGAILGTFVTGFFLIGVFPTRPTVFAVGLGMALLGLVTWSAKSSWRVAAIGAMTLAGVGLLVSDGLCDQDTKYHCAIVEVDPDRLSGRVLILDRLRNSYVDLDDPSYLEFRYISLMADVIDTQTADGALDVLSIGGGGFTMPGFLANERPGTKNTVLEIDPLLVEIGEKQLALSPEVEVVVGDGRIGILDVDDDSVDVVIGDAFSGRSVPWHLTTVEFVAEIDRVMRTDGVYVMNVIDRDAKEFVKAESITLSQVFAHVVLFAPPSYLEGTSGGNFVIVSSQAPIDVSAIEELRHLRDTAEIGWDGARLEAFVGDADVLTDDYAPVDQILGG